MVTLKEIEAAKNDKNYDVLLNLQAQWHNDRNIGWPHRDRELHYMRYIERLEEQVKPIAWTTTKPTGPGIYLWKWQDEVNPVKIEQWKDNGSLIIRGSVRVPANALQLKDGEWAGPIQEPREAS